MRETMGASVLFGSFITSRRIPSIRQRIFSSFSSGSMCMSLARFLAAYSIILVKALLIGKSETMASRFPDVLSRGDGFAAIGLISAYDRPKSLATFRPYCFRTWRIPLSVAA